MDLENDLHQDPPPITTLGGSLTSAEEVNSMGKKKQGKGAVKGTTFSNDDSSVKTDVAAITDPLQDSPILPDLSSSEAIVEFKMKNRKRKRKNSKNNVAKSNVDGCEVDFCPGVNEEKDENTSIKSEEKSGGKCGIEDCTGYLGQGGVHAGPEFSLDDSLVKTEAAIKDPLHEPSSLPDLSISEPIIELKTKKSKRRKRKNAEHNVAKTNVDVCDTPENTSAKTCIPALDMPLEHTIQRVSTDVVGKQSCVDADICLRENEEKEQNMVIKDEGKSTGECGIRDCSADLGQGVEHTGPDFSLDDSSVKIEAAIMDTLLSCSEGIREVKTRKKCKRKRKNTENNVAKTNADGCDNPDNTSSKSCTPAFDMPLEHTIQCVSTDAVMKQSPVEADICLGETEEKDENVSIMDAEKTNQECDIIYCSGDLGQGAEHSGRDVLLDGSSVKTDAAMLDPLHEPSALPDLSSSEQILEVEKKKNRKSKRAKTEHIVAKSNVNSCGTPENMSSKTSTPGLDMPPDTIQCVSTNAVMKQSYVEADICVGQNEEKNENMLLKDAERSNGECDIQDCSGDLGQCVEHTGPEFSIDYSSVKTDVVINDPLHEHSALPDLSNSEGTIEVKMEKTGKAKRKNSQHNAVKSNVDGCVISENTSSPKTSAPVLDMPPEHTNQCVSIDAAMKQSCVEAHICQGENEDKNENMPIKDGEKSKEGCVIQNDGCNCNPVVENAELFTKESVLDVVKIKVEQSINDNSSDPEEKSDSVTNGSLAKKHDDDLIVNDLSDNFQGVKTYARKKVLNSTYMDCPSDVNCNKEPTMQDHHEDYSHKFSDEPSTDGLMERETEHSRDRVTSHSGVAAEETELGLGNSSDQRFVATSSVADIPVMQLDKTIISNSKNKLLILDVNGLLADCVAYEPSRYHQLEPDFWIGRRKVYKRPFCDDFLQFCFERFHVGVWSSRAKFNVDGVIKFLMGESASKLLFCWNQSHCTSTKFSTVENRDKPLVFKELRKIWEQEYPGLPWVKGEFNESNTLLLDDSPYKALLNPMHTAIFPYSYRYYDSKDSCLGPGGDLRVYLEGLAMAENVQEYVASNPFGQRPIREANPSWGYYCRVIQSVKAQQK